MRLQTAYLLIVSILAFFSCKKEVANMPPNNTQAGVAYVSVVHAVPNASSLEFAFDKNRPSLNFFNYTDRVSYLNAFAGTRKFSVFQKGSSDTLISKGISLLEGKNYTIFIADILKNMDAVVVRDSSRAPGADSVRIRFANMSPDAGNLDLYLEGGSTPIISNISYKTAADFISVKAANNVAFEVKLAGQNTVFKKSARLNLLNGNYYTVWTTGLRMSAAEHLQPRVETFWH